jgi:hypothetical protein
MKGIMVCSPYQLKTEAKQERGQPNKNLKSQQYLAYGFSSFMNLLFGRMWKITFNISKQTKVIKVNTSDPVLHMVFFILLLTKIY